MGASIFQTAYMIPSALHITITVPRASTVYVLATDPKGHWGVKLKTDAGWTAEEWSSAFNQPVWSKLFAAGASETLPPTTAGTMGSSNHVTVLVQAETRGVAARSGTTCATARFFFNPIPPLGGSLCYCTSAQEAINAKRRKKTGSSVA